MCLSTHPLFEQPAFVYGSRTHFTKTASDMDEVSGRRVFSPILPQASVTRSAASYATYHTASAVRGLLSSAKVPTEKRMGLDMYATRRLHTKQWEHQKPEDRYAVNLARGGKAVSGIELNRISKIEEEVMYWRKANHIHGWFVANVQDGTDNCQPYYVSEEKLKELHAVCDKVLKHSKLVDGMVLMGTLWTPEKPEPVEQREPGKVIGNPMVAQKLLPRTAGLFFGGQEYDEFYIEDVKETRDWAAHMLGDIRKGVPGDIYYESSW